MTKLEVGKEYWFKGKVERYDKADVLTPYLVEFGGSSTSWIPNETERVEVISEREKVTIPKFVAEYIEDSKMDKRELYIALKLGINLGSKELSKWLRDVSNQCTLARAWLDGYEIEKEPLYWVRDKRDDPILLKWSTGGITTGASSVDKATQRKHKEIYTFTEKEIKDYDERYWAFAVPVEEDDE